MPSIEYKDLNKAMQGCNKHINNLLKTSLKHYEEKNYPQCLVDSILAFEEITKFAVYAKHHKELRGVSKSTARQLEDHKYKLTIWIEDERLRRMLELENAKNISKQDKVKQRDLINKSAEQERKLFVKFDKIKQLGMYSDFVNGTTISLDEHFMKNDITENNLQVFCHYLFRYTNYRLFLEVLRHQCGNSQGIIDKNGDCVKRNQNYQHIVEFEESYSKDKDSVTYRKFLSTTLELEKLVDYLNKTK